MGEKVYVNCARCELNFGVTSTYFERKTANHEIMLCNDCRNQGEVIHQ